MTPIHKMKQRHAVPAGFNSFLILPFPVTTDSEEQRACRQRLHPPPQFSGVHSPQLRNLNFWVVLREGQSRKVAASATRLCPDA